MPCEESAILENLTDAQREAVTHKDGPMLVVAGAGSGKTRVVTRRIAWLIRQGVWPSQILAMTFTNKAATEMQTRVTGLVGEAPASMGTFHSCCARFLRRDLEKLPTAGRPVSQRDGVAAIYEKRKPLYEAFADRAVDNNGPVEETVDAILR